jgi:UDP-2,4-diacetamido-2,4,6-trideoxy-beta-L-altropyranose hydrolase
MTHLLIRADASHTIGTGHVMRCLALAQACLQAGGRATLVSTRPSAWLEERMALEGLPVIEQSWEPGSAEDARATVAAAQEAGASWVVVDGYFSGAEYQRSIKSAGCRLLVVDDYQHAARYEADMVLNQNPAAEALEYPRKPETKLLLGTRFALLRREFWGWRGRQPPRDREARKLLVSLGGSDPGNVAIRVLRAAEAIAMPGLSLDVVCGPETGPDLGDAARGSRHIVRILRTVEDMAALMAETDAAVSAGGSTVWELAFMGVPFVVLASAENQRPNAEWLVRHGGALYGGWHADATAEALAEPTKALLRDSSLRATLAARGRELVDGDGVERVLMRLEGRRLRLRRALEADSRLIWTWANDPETRAQSFSTEPIPWERHLAWYAATMADRSRNLLIAVDEDDNSIGQLRLDCRGSEALLSFSIAGRFRGRGLAAILLEAGTAYAFGNLRVSVVNGYVKPDNVRSNRAFEKVGYRRSGEEIRGQDVATHYFAGREEWPHENR